VNIKYSFSKSKFYLYRNFYLQDIQQQNDDEIRRLQHEITRIRGEHVNGMSRMKLNFEKQIQQQRTKEHAKVQGVRREANEVFIFLAFFLLNLIIRPRNNLSMIKQ
jgi:hypothetical protein